MSIAATTGDETLTSKDVVDMLDELLEAQNKSRIFGLKLKLPLHVVDSIHATYPQPEDRLLQVLIEFTKQTDPGPTWRVITDALRSPAVNLPHLAEKVEAAHFPDPTSTRDVVSEITPTGIYMTAIVSCMSFSFSALYSRPAHVLPQFHRVRPSLMSLMMWSPRSTLLVRDLHLQVNVFTN